VFSHRFSAFTWDDHAAWNHVSRRGRRFGKPAFSAIPASVSRRDAGVRAVVLERSTVPGAGAPARCTAVMREVMVPAARTFADRPLQSPVSKPETWQRRYVRT
jgi:hypothetical protein